jgi:hypothetical protein
MAQYDLVCSDEDPGTKETVVFTVVLRYDPGQAIVCEYKINPEYTVQSRDYVALYAADEFRADKTLSNYITWQWADIRSTSSNRTINFPARHLPEASTTFLLFAYVSRSRGVIGSSDVFQILPFCGDPISITSCTTDKSSFVVLEKNPSDFSKSQNYDSKEAEVNPFTRSHCHYLQKAGEIQIEEVLTHYQPERASERISTGTGNICTIDQPEVTVKEDIASSENQREVTHDHEIDCTSEIGEIQIEQLVKDTKIPNNGEFTVNDVDHLQSELLCELGSTVKEKEEISQCKSQPRRDLGNQVAGEVVTHYIPEKQSYLTALHDQIAQLTQDNQYLSNEVVSGQKQLEAREQDLACTKDKLRKANSKIRDLKHALITERLSYENSLKRLLAANPAVNSTSENKDLGHTLDQQNFRVTLKGEGCDESSGHEDPVSFIPLQKRSASALVRLGIEDEVSDRSEGESSDIRCPICSKPALSFRDQAAFHIHVNEHFSD